MGLTMTRTSVVFMLLCFLAILAVSCSFNIQLKPLHACSTACFASGSGSLPSVITSPVLKQVYPKLLEWNEVYGHPNIPLGSSEGRQCKTLRRLQTQQKLTTEEVTLLEKLGFRFNDLEDVYFEASFEDMIARLQAYEEENHNNYQVPKKYPQDPELGAWVTGLRRLGPEGVDPIHAERLNTIHFSWVSSRKCGSQFMKQYRELVHRVQNEGLETVLQESTTQNWMEAQREARRRGTLSDTRFHYLRELFGKDQWEDEEQVDA